MFRDKGLIIGIVATVLLIAGGVVLMTRGSSDTPAVGSQVSSDILVPKTAYVTGGIENSDYVPATSSAKITLVEFGDFQCPACGDYHPLVKQLLTEFKGQINFAFRNYPLSQHANAQASAQAAEAAGLQGKYWQMHDKLYESQSEWSASTDPKRIFTGYAQALELNTDKFSADFDSQEIQGKIKSDTNDGNLIRVNATPTFYINGIKVESLPGSYDELKKIITDELAKNN